jgi:choice-of-anchor A domain-containing protein
VIYNLPTATNLNLSEKMNPMGSILAPTATVVGGYGALSGELIAAAYSGTTSFESVAFSCTLPSAQ